MLSAVFCSLTSFLCGTRPDHQLRSEASDLTVEGRNLSVPCTHKCN